MSVPYLVTFKPLERFYFGTPQSFGESFYAISSMFPTQTTILGVIRTAILEQNSLLDLKTKKPMQDRPGNLLEKVVDLTGTAKADDLFSEDSNLGKIIKISPVFLVRQNEKNECPEDFLFQVPNDIIYEFDKYEKEDDGSPKVKGLKLLEFLKTNDVKVYSRNTDLETTFSLGKKIKDYTADYLGGIGFWQSYQEYNSHKKLKFNSCYQTNKVFIRDSQPGIARENRKTKEAHYYIKNDYRLKDDFSFGVIVHFSEEGLLRDDEVFMGGEKSLFRMKVKNIKEDTYLIKEHPIIKRLIKENDFGDFDGSEDKTFTQSKLVAFSNFISQRANFVGLEFALINDMYIHRNIWERNKTDSYSAIPYGSILFVDGMLSLDNKNNPNGLYKKIGFNYLISFNR